ncbi:hypothetical protein IF2G_03769 [Cordyceps javanica]|nr:hypothetical protein IF2G_03769 [Cordyceps javanica]
MDRIVSRVVRESRPSYRSPSCFTTATSKDYETHFGKSNKAVHAGPKFPAAFRLMLPHCLSCTDSARNIGRVWWRIARKRAGLGKSRNVLVVKDGFHGTGYLGCRMPDCSVTQIRLCSDRVKLHGRSFFLCRSTGAGASNPRVIFQRCTDSWFEVLLGQNCSSIFFLVSFWFLVRTIARSVRR